MPSYLKDPSASLDYGFDWNDWLTPGESIASYVITPETGITLDHDSISSNIITVWLSGGTVGEWYDVACKVTTDSVPPRIDERTISIQMQNR